MKTKLIFACALLCSACLGFLVGRIHRPINLTIIVTGDIVDHDGMGLRNGISATMNDVELIALGNGLR